MTTRSPYASAAADLIALGYHVVPIAATGKYPATKTGDHWRAMGDWPRFRERMPTPFETEIWESWADANIGIVLGSAVGDRQLVAIDVDTDDVDEVEEIRAALPYSPMTKRGRKGLTLFYRGDMALNTRGYQRRGAMLLEVLTGRDTKQTVVPPSIHPDTEKPYVWLSGGAVAVSDLPTLSVEDIEALEETLEGLGWKPGGETDEIAAAKGTRIVEGGLDTPFADLNAQALAQLPRWVEKLDLYNLQNARGGYECVAIWRESGTGRANQDRKRNLSIQPSGIKDFGTLKTYSPIDLVMTVQSCSFEAAFAWLDNALGNAPIGMVYQGPTAIVSDSGELSDEEVTALEREIEEDEPEVIESGVSGEIDVSLCFPPGLVGTIAKWICDTSRRPQPQLALAASLCLVGTAMGRQYAGPTHTGSHIYALGIAPTGAGKDHPMQCTKRILAAAGMANHLGPGEFISSTALINFMTRSPLGFCAMDEFGAFMARINSRKAGGFEKAVGGVLRTAWGSSFAPMPTPEWAQKRSSLIHAPALSLFGVSTPEEFFGSLTGLDATNGVLNRFLIFHSIDRPTAVDPEKDASRVPISIAEGLKLIMHSQGAIVASNINQADTDPSAYTLRCPWAEDGARELFNDYQWQIEQASDGNPQYAAFYSRAAEYAQRLALIRCVGIKGGKTAVTREGMEWAIKVVDTSFGYVMQAGGDYIADTDAQARAQEIVRAIRQRGGKLARRGLMRALAHRYSTRDVEDALKMLMESGAIEGVQRDNPKGGHPLITYRLGD